MLPYVAALALARTPPAEYATQRLEGWTVHVERRLARERPKLWEATRGELAAQFRRIVRVVPDGPLARLRTVPFWIHLRNPANPGAAYHPSRAWLVEHGQNPDMAHAVEIGDAEHFVAWTYDQPWMAMHELAHAYHFRFLPKREENPEAIAAFEAAVASRRYESVLRGDGRTERAYALNDKMEYFAETTEAYFGQNDFYPFVRAELRAFDPTGYGLMRSVWGDPATKVPGG